jgi:glycosyltransferase involved in cell wall biosynthesis
MVAIAKDFRPDVIYSSQQHWDCLAATYIAKRLDKPQIIHLHYNIGPWLRRQPMNRLLTCDRVVTVSEFIRQDALLHGCTQDQVVTVFNAAPILPPAPAGAREAIRAELGIPVDALVIGNVSRLDPGKGHIDIIDAFDVVADRHRNAWLVIVGGGTIEDDLVEHARSKSMANRIVFTGRRSDVPSLLSAFDIFVHPSYKEPCGLAVMEASLASLPVVAYADGGITEIVEDGVTGLLAATGDVEELASHMAELITNEGCRERLGRAGQSWITSNFQPEKAGSLFADVVTGLAEGAHRP